VPNMAPTHSVKHPQLGEANIYLSASLLGRLESRNTDVRDGARSSVCIRFRKACQAKAGDQWNWVEGQPFIEWGHLTIRKLPDPEQVASTPVVTASPRTEGTCCDDDDCINCDIGYHERCPNCGLLG